MNQQLQRVIIDYIFDNLQYLGLNNQVCHEYSAYIFDGNGEYLIGGQEVADFITKAIKLIEGKK